MSLNRVASIEGLERERSDDSTTTSYRRMSFNPVDHWAPDMSKKTPNVEPVRTFDEIPKGKRLLQCAIAVLYCLLSAGVVFGYAAIKPVLIDEGVYSELCSKDEIEDGTTPCYGQEIRLNLMFTIAAVSTNVCALPVGTILDRYGPRACGIIGSILLAIGSALFAFGRDLPFDSHTSGYLFLALGGPFVFISSFQLSNCFPAHSGLVLALLTGAFDSSSALFLIFRLIFEGTGGRVTTRELFLIYLIVPIFIFVAQLTIMPSQSYKTVGEIVKLAEDEVNAPTPDDSSVTNNAEAERRRSEHRMRRDSVISEINSLLETSTNSKRAKREDKKNKRSGVWGALHGYSAFEQIKTPWFWLITMFTVIQMTRINYFVATVRPQYRYLLHSDEEAKTVNQIFDVLLPLGGVLSIPFIGSILDRTSTPFALASLVVTATLIGILGVIPKMWAAIANICLFVIYRPFYYTAVSDYSAKVFGFQTFGKVYGLIICLAGLFNFIQSPLDALTHKAFHNNPLPVNLILMGVAIVVGVALVIYVYSKSRNIQRQFLEVEAEGARERLMPDVTMNGERGYGT
ncbi:hypothetical protein GJ744_006547 [Endocarpon pusillum]|uniref:Protein FMP42 n=1 Tax=Endocarpon pusillum TaxID=364733 RepID=A0A8H7ARK6_9EURO|nr:hypothetical protein GJ744_006547 [Endocarpon pusillum]